MGINYYFTLHGSTQRLHIGKSSAGWVFLMKLHPELEIHTWNDWKQFLTQDGQITSDHDNAIVTVQDLTAQVECRQRKPFLLEDVPITMLRALVEKRAAYDKTCHLFRPVDDQVFSGGATYVYVGGKWS